MKPFRKRKILRSIALGALFTASAFGFSGCGSSDSTPAPVSPPAMTLPVNTQAPRFQGLCSVGVAGPSTVSLSWGAAIDSVDTADRIRYQVFASTTPGGQDFNSPLLTTAAGQTSVLIGQSAFPPIAAGTEVFFVVRAIDSAQNSDGNTAEVRVTPNANNFFVDASAGGGGTGSQDSPFNTIQAGVDAAETAGGGNVLIASGTYGEQVILDGNVSTINLQGGFPAFSTLAAGASEIQLLQARNIAGNPTTVDGNGVVLTPDGLIDVDNGGANTLIDGFRVMNSAESNIRAEDARLQVSCCELLGVTTTPDGVEIDTSTRAQTSNIWLLGNRFQDLDDSIFVGGGVSSLQVSANTMFETDNALRTGSDLLGANIIVPSNGTANISIQGNSVSRSGEFDFDFEPQVDGTPGNLDLRLLGNDIFSSGVSSEGAVEISDLGYVGQGGSSRLEMRSNRVQAIGDDFLNLDYFGHDPDRVPDGPTTVLIEDNQVAQNDYFIDVSGLSGANNADASFTVRNNEALLSQSDTIEIDMGVGAAGLNDGGNVTLVVDGNTFGGQEFECLDFTGGPHPGGSLVIDLLNNTQTAGEGGFELSAGDLRGVNTGAASSTEIRMLNNHMVVQDEDHEVRVSSYGGRSFVLVANNTVGNGDSSDQAFDFDFATPSDVNGTLATAPGSVDFLLINNSQVFGEDNFLEYDNSFDGDSEVNIYVANSTQLQPADEGNFDIDVAPNDLLVLERNAALLAGQSSDQGLELGFNTNTPGLGFSGRVQNNVFAFASADGIRVNSRLFPEIVNNTVYRNGAENGEGLEASATSAFSQLQVENNIVAENGNDDLDQNPLVRATYSLIGDLSPVTGLGNLAGDPVLALAGQILDVNSYFALAATSPAVNAGNPAAEYNDPDGTRNDMGAFGGPAAGVIGYQADVTEIPLTTIGLRPFSDLSSGRRLLAAAQPVEIIFTTELDATTVNASTVAFTSGGTPVNGVLNTDGRRVTFTPGGGFTPGSAVTVTVSGGLRDTAGVTLRNPFVSHFAVEPTAAAAEAESNDTFGSAQALAGRVFRISGSQNSGGGDASDFFSFTASSGDRLQATVFAERGIGGAGDFTLRLLDTDGTTVLNESIDVFGPNGDDPYVNFTFENDGTYFLQVVEDTASGGAVNYELEGWLR